MKIIAEIFLLTVLNCGVLLPDRRTCDGDGDCSGGGGNQYKNRINALSQLMLKFQVVLLYVHRKLFEKRNEWNSVAVAQIWQLKGIRRNVNKRTCPLCSGEKDAYFWIARILRIGE
jgi:hypothetical protein